MSSHFMRNIFFLTLFGSTGAFHDCVQRAVGHRLPPNLRSTLQPPSNCSGGLCVGMHGGPHEGGPAAYPVGSREKGFTSVYSEMTVPEMPKKVDGVTYYIWTDIFFGDMSQGRMNQFVPQLILGNALDGSSGAPMYKPHFGFHSNYSFAAHYFFEVLNSSSGQITSHAAYGDFFPAIAGETLFTKFEQAQSGGGDPYWTLTMGALDDASRVSTVVAKQPYMGIGASWDEPTVSWSENNYTNMCINACWELYGVIDRDHLPSSGSQYDIYIDRKQNQFDWVTQWDEDEGAGTSCAESRITQKHNATMQHVKWDISV